MDYSYITTEWLRSDIKKRKAETFLDILSTIVFLNRGHFKSIPEEAERIESAQTDNQLISFIEGMGYGLTPNMKKAVRETFEHFKGLSKGEKLSVSDKNIWEKIKGIFK